MKGLCTAQGQGCLAFALFLLLNFSGREGFPSPVVGGTAFSATSSGTAAEGGDSCAELSSPLGGGCEGFPSLSLSETLLLDSPSGIVAGGRVSGVGFPSLLRDSGSESLVEPVPGNPDSSVELLLLEELELELELDELSLSEEQLPLPEDVESSS